MVIIGLGSNVGERAEKLREAVALIESEGLLRRLRRSSTIQTPALLPAGAPREWDMPFLNMAVAGETSLAPRELLASLKRLEARLGRQARGRWAPREIDLDILAWDDRVLAEAELVVPHAGLLEREFALRPLAELCGGWRYPAPGLNHGLSAAALARRFGGLPALVGIVNVTPDSFSDGGLHLDPAAAVARARALVAEGAQALDIGAESTRPGASPLTASEEWRRLEPVLSELAGPASRPRESWRALLSVDTRHAETARRALKLGVDWLNDVGGLTDPEMVRAVADAGVDAVVMHSLTVPADRAVTLSEEADPVEAVLAWGEKRLSALEREGVARERVLLDPGIGFGKTPAQSLALLRGARRFGELGARVLLGHSRKSFFGMFTGRDFADRDVETLSASLELAGAADYLRVHNVDWHARAFRVKAALAAGRKP